jgi:hypothetical protein
MSFARSIGALIPLVFATSVALADDPPAAPLATGSASTPSAVPANAPIVLSPGVPATSPKSAPTETPHASERPRHREWFGYQTLAVDIAIVGAATVLLRTTDESRHLAIFLGASALYLGVAPLIHYANKSTAITGSLVVRAIALGAGATIGGILISGFAGCTEQTPCKLELVDFLAIGAGVGAMVGAITDATWYAWKITPATTAYLRPAVDRVRGGATFGVAIAY